MDETKSETDELRRELEQARKQNLAFAADFARTYSDERRKTQVLSRTQNQLARSAKLATLGQMVAAIAHDVKNMISPIGGYADLLLMSPDLTDNGRKYAERIRAASSRAETMLNSLTDFGSDRGGKRSAVSVDTVVKAASALLEYNLTRKGVKIVTDFEPNLPAVCADAGQFEQVMVNLMVNAQHAMENKGGGELKITAKRSKSAIIRPGSGQGSSKSGMGFASGSGFGSMHSGMGSLPKTLSTTHHACVSISITDQGDGIPPHVMDRIFEPFFTTKEKGKGTGLGLFICHDIIEQHGGNLDVSSVVGQGATFTITLPEYDAAQVTEVAHQS